MNELEFLNAIIINGRVHVLNGPERDCKLCSVREQCFEMRGDFSLCEIFSDKGGYFRNDGEVRPIPLAMSLS